MEEALGLTGRVGQSSNLCLPLTLCDLGGINITSLGSIKSYIIKIKNWKLIVTLIVYFEVRVYRWKYIIKK